MFSYDNVMPLFFGLQALFYQIELLCIEIMYTLNQFWSYQANLAEPF